MCAMRSQASSTRAETASTIDRTRPHSHCMRQPASLLNSGSLFEPCSNWNREELPFTPETLNPLIPSNIMNTYG